LPGLFLGRIALQSLLCIVQGGGGIVGGEVDQGEVEVDRRGVGTVLQGEAEVRDGRGDCNGGEVIANADY
jgi:hypothetical protein